MNANEIAQEFEDYLKAIEELPWGNHQILCDQAATMLRQQAEQINNLQQWQKSHLDLIDTLKYEKSSGVYDDEPVAWIINGRLSDEFYTTSELDKIIPLYTHPADLTDEEIGQIWKDCMESPYMQVSNPVGFARAILRKAQEK